MFLFTYSLCCSGKNLDQSTGIHKMQQVTYGERGRERDGKHITKHITKHTQMCCGSAQVCALTC